MGVFPTKKKQMFDGKRRSPIWNGNVHWLLGQSAILRTFPAAIEGPSWGLNRCRVRELRLVLSWNPSKTISKSQKLINDLFPCQRSILKKYKVERRIGKKIDMCWQLVFFFPYQYLHSWPHHGLATAAPRAIPRGGEGWFLGLADLWLSVFPPPVGVFGELNAGTFISIEKQLLWCKRQNIVGVWKVNNLRKRDVIVQRLKHEVVNLRADSDANPNQPRYH